VKPIITLLGGAAALWPLAARTQDPGRFCRIGVLEMSPAASNAANFDLPIGFSHRPRDGSVVSSLHCMNDPQPEGHMASYVARRKFLATLLGGAASAWPSAAREQGPGKIPRIGIIDDSPRWNAFRHGLRDLGYLEGQNIAFDYAYGDGVPERLAEAAAALVRRPVDVIATYATPASFAAKQATTTIPIVMISIGDPVRAGLVPSLARPGGNITGNTILGPDVGAKRVQILKEAIPTVSRVAFLWNPDNASNVLQFEEIRAAAPTLGVTVISVSVSPRIEFEAAFAAMMKERPMRWR
jgi:putative tryptophan/tyrosine transport system substrate-binding protein